MDDRDQILSIRTGRDPEGTPVVVLAGELDLTGTERAERAFADLTPAGVDGADPAPIIVDMSELTFMDSAGLTLLLRVVKHGQAIRLRRPTPTVRRLVAATGLDEILPIEP